MLLPLLLTLPLHAESLVTLRDPLYAAAPVPPQAVEVAARIRQIAYPVMGMPALVQPGDTFSVMVRPGCDISLGGIQASLRLVRSSPEVVVPLKVVEVRRRDPVKEMVRISLEVPMDAGADHYDLRLDDGKCLRDAQPSSVRVYRESTAWRFAVLADEQIGDPRGKIPSLEPNGSQFPGKATDAQRRFASTVRSELEFLDPLFVLMPGDVVFGMDYKKEYATTVERYGDARLATFMVPGNHDAYASHVLVAQQGWRRSLMRLALCGKALLDFDPYDAVVQMGGCTVTTLKDTVSYKLEYDGLEGWRRTVGPEFYSFKVGNTRFVGLNTYEGSVARRQSLPISLDRLASWLDPDLGFPGGFDTSLGAPLVDNFGGYLRPDSVQWLEAQVKEARAAGEQVVLFGHHDPTGLFKGGLAFHPDTPFGTDPVASGGFEVWNYEGQWDSDPSDGAKAEQVDKNSATSLLSRLAEGNAWYFGGHNHHDDLRLLRPGESLGTTSVKGEVRIALTTTGAVLPSEPGSYKGYRMVQVKDGAIGSVDLDPARGWGSVPAGNFWVEDVPSGGGAPARVVVNGLPVPLSGRLRFELPANEVGYRFLTGDNHRVPLSDLYQTRESTVAWLDVTVPPALDLARTPNDYVRMGVRWEEAQGNDKPVARVTGVGEKEKKKSKPLKLKAGREVVLTAAESTDKDGLFRVMWDWGGTVQVGEQVTWAVPRTRDLDPIQLTVYDPYGAVGTVQRPVKVKCGFLGMACKDGGGSGKGMKVKVD